MTDSPPEPEAGNQHDQGNDLGDYNPESIGYETPQDDHSTDQDDDEGEEEYAPNQRYDSPRNTHSQSASRSPVVRATTTTSASSRQYDPLHPATESSMHDPESFKSPSSAHDAKAPSSTPAPAPVQTEPAASVLPKNVDLQALLAGLVPARTKAPPVSPPPPPSHEQPHQQYHQQPAPAVTLPPDIMAQLQKMTSPPPPQSTPTFPPPQNQPPTPQQPPPSQHGPIDIQPEDLRLTPQEEHLYEKFLANEREVVSSARWEDFPPGSRMFIGNLPHDRIGKKDVFRLFYPYGRLAQISIKVGYGFVQFYEKQDCDVAIRSQQGMIITGRKVHLEVSKPQKGREDGGGAGRGKRARSPLGARDRDRGRSPPPRVRGRGRGRGSYDYDDSRGRPVSRDYSPPPQARRFGRDDDYGGRRYSRSRSPPPPRSPPPRPRQLEVAIVVRDDPDRYQNDKKSDADKFRSYINHVEDSFEDRHLTTDVIFLNPRSSVPDLTRQLVLDGVIGVVSLSRQLQERRKVSIQTFQRNPADPGAVKWNEYNEIDIPTAIDLVLNIKRGPPPSMAAAPPGPPFSGYPPTQPYPPAVAPVAPTGVNPNLANIIGSLNPAALKQVFSAISQQPPLTQQTAYAGFNQPAPTQPAGPPVPGGYPAYNTGSQRPGTQQPTQQIQDIMAQLAAFSKKP